MRVRWLRQALEDWRSILLFAANQNRRHAADIIEAFEAKLRIIQAYPLIGHPAAHNPRMRIIRIDPGALTLFYAATHDEIEIRRIRPSRSRPLRPHIDF